MSWTHLELFWLKKFSVLSYFLPQCDCVIEPTVTQDFLHSYSQSYILLPWSWLKKKSSKKTHPQKVYSVAAQPSWKAGNLSSVLLHNATKIACCLLWCAFHLHLTSIMRPLFVTIISPTGEFIDAWIHVKVCLSHVLGVNFLKTTMKGIRRWRNKKKHSSWVILKEP